MLNNGFKDDEIYLLSVEEYEKYMERVPMIKSWWWLRSPRDNSETAAFVYSYDFVLGLDVYCDNGAVRPALKLNLKSENLQIGQRVMKYDFPWIVIDVENQIGIAEVPIAFDKFDDDSNDYETSYIRKFLNEWPEKRMK